MKLITYVLNEDGTVPEFIIDGGYYPSPNLDAPPQDIVLIGLVEDSVPGESFNSQLEIKNYLISIGGLEWRDIENNPLDLDILSNNLWQKVL